MMMLSKKITAAVLVFAVLVSMIIVITPVSVSAEGTSYYVDSASGNDSNDGKSESKPWKSLDKVNETTFQPGDKILFKCGSMWAGQLSPKGSGAEGKPITIDKYGTGDKPLFNGQGMEKPSVYLYNQQYWDIKNLEITNNSDTPGFRLGVQIMGEDAGVLNHIHLSDLYIHDIKGNNSQPTVQEGNYWKQTGGIGVKAIGSKVPTKFNDLLIEKCTIKNIDRTGIYTDSNWQNRGGIDYSGGDWFPHTNVVVRNNNLFSIGGDGIIVRHADKPLIEYNVAGECNSRCGPGVVNVAMWPRNADDAVMQFNEAYGTKTMNDGQGFDCDYNSNRTIVQYNYSHDNEGGFILICNTNVNKAMFNDRNTVRYNISQNDLGRTIELTGNTTNTMIYNNVFYIKNSYVAAVRSIVVYEDNGMSPKNAYFYNNIFFNEGMKGNTSYEMDKGENFVFENNCWYSDYDEYSHLQPKDPYKIKADPQFVNPGSGKQGINSVSGYKLKPTSPLINAGKVIEDNGGKDYWGNPLYKGAPDIGAFEFQGEVPPGISVKGKKIILKYAPEFTGKTLLAYPGDLAKSLGMKYSYNKKTKTATITKGKTKITMVTGSKTANVNGKKYTMPAAVKLNKMPLVPLEFLVEKLGCKYSYDSKEKIASIK